MIGDVRDYLRRTVWCDEPTRDLLAVYTVLCIIAPHGVFFTVPYLEVRGASGSGKSTLGRVLAGLTGGAVSGGRTPAALFRALDASPGQLMVLDEGEAVLRGSRRADFEQILLEGDHIDGTVERANRDDQHGVILYRVFGPKAIISIRGIDPSALQRRAAWVEMEPHPLDFVSRRVREEEARLKDALKDWAPTLSTRIQQALEKHQASRNFLSPTHRSLWAPLLAVAEVVGIDLTGICAVQGEVLEQRVSLDLGKALRGLSESLAPGRYHLVELRQMLAQRYGAKAALWSEERIGPALDRLGWSRDRDARGRYIVVHPRGWIGGIKRRVKRIVAR